MLVVKLLGLLEQLFKNFVLVIVAFIGGISFWLLKLCSGNSGNFPQFADVIQGIVTK